MGVHIPAHPQKRLLALFRKLDKRACAEDRLGDATQMVTYYWGKQGQTPWFALPLPRFLRRNFTFSLKKKVSENTLINGLSTHKSCRITCFLFYFRVVLE